MRPLAEFAADARRAVRFVLTDIDDTLTLEGRMPSAAFAAMERLRQAGLKVIPVTGRPAGWCDHIARMWPVDGVVGENGAFYFLYDEGQRTMARRYWKNAEERAADRRRLADLGARIVAAVPGAAVATDQGFRETDLAIDYREDVQPLSAEEAERIVGLLEAAGARAKVSSIHVNGWFGDYDKLTMTRLMLREIFDLDVADDTTRRSVAFVGDSPNDVPMFEFFHHAVGVANLREFDGRLVSEPAWLTERPGGYGFAEFTDALLEVR